MESYDECSVCGRTLFRRDIEDYWSEATNECVELCTRCREDFEEESEFSLTADVISVEEFAALAQFVATAHTASTYARPVGGEYVYTYEDGRWLFHRDGGVFESDTVAVLFEQDEPFDVLLRHGPADKMKDLFLSDRYSALAKTGCRLAMTTVPPQCCETLNKALSISGSKWCSRLHDEVAAVQGRSSLLTGKQIVCWLLLFIGASLFCSCAGLDDLPGKASPVTPGQVRAVCFGWNSVDSQAWGGWSGTLADCEFDANFAAAMWRSHGIPAKVLLTKKATREACRKLLEDSLRGMVTGDLLIVWISGHGGRRPDIQGEGADNVGEYVCAYDGPVTDNTINRWLTAVPAGVRILWVCDTCHSGTMFRSAPARFQRAAIPSGFAGELILLAGCSEDAVSLSTGQGGIWSTALQDTGPAGRSPITWFQMARASMTSSAQVPVYAEYGDVSDAFRHTLLVTK